MLCRASIADFRYGHAPQAFPALSGAVALPVRLAHVNDAARLGSVGHLQLALLPWRHCTGEMLLFRRII